MKRLVHVIALNEELHSMNILRTRPISCRMDIFICDVCFFFSVSAKY